MRSGQLRSERLYSLLRFHNKGASKKELYNKALTYGVTDRTAKSYVQSVYALVEEKKRRLSL